MRHIPIVIESNESDSENYGGHQFFDVGAQNSHYSGQTKLVTRGPLNVPINYSWSISYSDRFLDIWRNKKFPGQS